MAELEVRFGSSIVFTEREPEPIQPVFFDIDQVTAEAVDTLALLGGVTDKSKALEETGQYMQGLHNVLAADNPAGDLEVIAFCPVNVDDKVLTLRSLFRRFNKGDEDATENRAFWQLLDQYGTPEVNSRTAMGVPAFVLGNQALALLLGGNTHGDERLHYPGKTGKEQAGLLQETQKATLEDKDRQTRELTTSIPDDIVLAARAVLRDEPLPHQSTWNRKAHMKPKKVDDFSYFPDVYTSGSALRLDGDDDDGYGYVGVSRSVGQKEVPQA